MADADVRAVAAEEATASGLTPDAVMSRVRRYAEEIVPQFNARLHHRVAYRLARLIATTLFRVRVGYVHESTRQEIPSDASVIFVISHRSNLDYVLVAFLVAEHVALSFAVGEWARVWPLDTLLRSLGAFFVRRSSKDRVYRKVLERYVQLGVRHGVTQGMFLEGGLSRDGRMLSPKLGLLSYATRQMSRDSERDVMFVPVAINYDRVLEDRTLLLDLDPQAERPSPVRTVVAGAIWVAKNLRLYARGRLHRFGYACVNFGPPLSLRRYLEERDLDLSALSEHARFAETERLATLLMAEVAHHVPVTPVSLVATALLSFDDAGATHSALAQRVTSLVEELNSIGAHLYLPRNDPQYFLDVGLRMLTLRRLVLVDEGAYRIPPAEFTLVRFYANTIEHFFATRGVRGRATGGPVRPRSPRAVVLVHGLARTSRSMSRLAHALEQTGYEVYNWDYPSRQYGVLPLVEALEAYAREAATVSERVDFVTHSMGGLLARGVLGRGALTNPGRLVMLAPPNQGAKIAAWASEFAWARGFFGQALQDLRTDRVPELASGQASPSCEFGVIAGTQSFHPLQPTSYYSSLTRPPGSHDGTVAVEETRMEGMTDFICVKANHTFIMDHDETVRQTLHFLEHGRFMHAGRATTP